jgi:putative FmdB family regulatory protein
MPLYEYKCNKCGAVFEKLQKFSDEPVTTHGGCGGPVERLLSPPAFHFKGSGFYITDYARNSNGHSPAAKPESKNGTTTAKTETPASPKPADAPSVSKS